MWHGMLTMAGFNASTVPCRMWKSTLGLTGAGKDASRQLAMRIFPHMQDVLKWVRSGFPAVRPWHLLSM